MRLDPPALTLNRNGEVNRDAAKIIEINRFGRLSDGAGVLYVSHRMHVIEALADTATVS